VATSVDKSMKIKIKKERSKETRKEKTEHSQCLRHFKKEKDEKEVIVLDGSREYLAG